MPGVAKKKNANKKKPVRRGTGAAVARVPAAKKVAAAAPKKKTSKGGLTEDDIEDIRIIVNGMELYPDDYDKLLAAGAFKWSTLTVQGKKVPVVRPSAAAVAKFLDSLNELIDSIVQCFYAGKWHRMNISTKGVATWKLDAKKEAATALPLQTVVVPNKKKMGAKDSRDIILPEDLDEQNIVLVIDGSVIDGGELYDLLSQGVFHRLSTSVTIASGRKRLAIRASAAKLAEYMRNNDEADRSAEVQYGDESHTLVVNSKGVAAWKKVDARRAGSKPAAAPKPIARNELWDSVLVNIAGDTLHITDMERLRDEWNAFERATVPDKRGRPMKNIVRPIANVFAEYMDNIRVPKSRLGVMFGDDQWFKLSKKGKSGYVWQLDPVML